MEIFENIFFFVVQQKDWRVVCYQRIDFNVVFILVWILRFFFGVIVISLVVYYLNNIFLKNMQQIVYFLLINKYFVFIICFRIESLVIFNLNLNYLIIKEEKKNIYEDFKYKNVFVVYVLVNC